MTYPECVSYLFNAAPLFQNIGAGAYKEGLANTLALDEHFGHPHRAFATIHVGGTNGKGSVSHTLAAILQSAGYRVGLYTSPHLVDFRERIRVNGEMMPEQRVIDFVEQERAFFEPLHPSFFELATALAFSYFREQQVDIAVVEVGLGGRLDCTNIISPLLSIITNISFDHTQFLGTTLPAIATEKAGIIKPRVPVVVGETGGHADVRLVFVERAREMAAPITFADELDEIISWQDGTYVTRHFGTFSAELRGLCQERNTATLLAALQQLRPLLPRLSIHHIVQGFSHVCSLTGLMGRWQTLRMRPAVVCDTAHNPAGLQYIAQQLRTLSLAPHARLRVVLGMVSDKDVRSSLRLFPQEAVYYFTQASVRRAMPAADMAALGIEAGLQGSAFPSVSESYRVALADACPDDFIYVGGSTFVVADLLKFMEG